MGSKESLGVNKNTHGTTSSSFKAGHKKGRGMPERPTTTKRAGHKV